MIDEASGLTQKCYQNHLIQVQYGANTLPYNTIVELSLVAKVWTNSF